MKAVLLPNWKSDPQIVEVEEPTPGPGQVVLKIAGAGLCHSDLHLLHDFEEGMLPWHVPFILGHENSGYVHAVGEGVDTVQVGQAMAVFGPWGCGKCDACGRGQDTYCIAPLDGYDSAFGGGLGTNGGQAEYMLVPDARFLVPIPEGMDPVAAAPLTDAGLTPYHAVNLSVHKMVPGSNVVVIGAGGLGHMGIQIIKAMTAANVVAVDVKAAARDLALKSGADVVLDGGADDVVDQIKEATKGGAEVVIDFVGTDGTLATAAASCKYQSDLTLVGVAGGSFGFNLYAPPYETAMRSIYWGTRAELRQVLALAGKGLITPEYSTYSLDDALTAYGDMEAGRLTGRAVITP
ncbi:MAG: alcohol dehydrogenase catalytic domain-containing protein [Actinomycetales bacterium]|nr:alcohol dehydrogenase catalytic domain-containing protein [Actinomycetales bacterium]